MTEIHPQFIQAAGIELVVITRAEFDALVSRANPEGEDDADAALFAARVADVQAGRDAPLPADVTAFILKGDTLLRALRKWKGLTQADLSRATDLTQSYISEIESGTKSGTVHALRRLADAFEVPAAWILAEAATQG